MKIVVRNIKEVSDKILISFESDIGTGNAIWKSLSCEPIIGHTYDAEFDIEDNFEMERTAVYSEKHSYQLSCVNNKIHLNGLLESMDDDGMIYFRLGKDCLIMIESEINEANVGKWFLLTFDFNNFEITVQ